MFQYSNMIHSPVNEATIKMPDSQHLSASYSSHYHYDPEFYHDSTAWQPPVYPEVSPEDYSAQAMRPRTTTSLWDDEGTVCYQVDVRGICVARRQDNDMINGTKLLNVTGMSRGKRDGILKNEKGRVVVKVGAMHLKGVWVTFARAKALAIQYSIADFLYPLFVDDPAMYFYSNQLSQNCYIPHNPIYLQSQDSLINTTTTTATTTATNTMHSPTNTTHTTHNTSATMLPLSSSYPAISNPMNYPIYSEHEYYLTHTSMNDLPLAPSVPSMLPVNYSVDKMSYY